MKTKTPHILVVWASLGALFLVPWVAAAPNAQPTGESTLLLLHSGQVLQGKITPLGDRYEVISPGEKVYVKASEVQCHCQTLEEAYEHRRAVIQSDSAQDHLDMVQWCLKAGLAGAAKRELADASARDSSHPLIPLMQRRIDVAGQPQEKSAAAATASVGPSVQELERMIRGMPPKTVEMYARQIQPMLVNNCSAAGCHGQGSGREFQLLRVPPGGPASPRLTQRNIYATIRWVNFDDPASSPLLKAPSGPHGSLPAAIFTNRQLPQYKQLVEWCYRVAQVPPPVAQASYEEPVDDVVTSSASSRGAKHHVPKSLRPPAGESSDRGASALRDVANQGKNSARGAANAQSRGTRSPMAARLPGNGKSGAANLQDRQGGMAPESGGADPFDPEAFNRRYAPPERMAPSAEEPQDYFGAAETPAQSPRSAKPIPSEIPEDGARFER